MSSTVVSTNTDDSFQTIYVGNCRKISFTSSSVAAASAMNPTTTAVHLFATQNCWVRFADTATPAVANDGYSFYLPANMDRIMGIKPGQFVAAIRDSVDGDLHIIEGANA